MSGEGEAAEETDAVDPPLRVPRRRPSRRPSRPRRRRGPATMVAIGLGLASLIGLLVLAAVGFEPAFYLFLLAVVGVLMIAIGSRLH